MQDLVQRCRKITNIGGGANVCHAASSRVKTRRGVSGPKMDLLCEPAG